MGSTVHEVLLLFAGRYLIPLLIAFAIAAPIGYRLSMQWLQNFAEHTPIHWWFLRRTYPDTLVVLPADFTDCRHDCIAHSRSAKLARCYGKSREQY